MAFFKEPSKYKRSFLAQVKHLVSKTMYRAFEIILTPCCTPTIVNVDIVCGTNYDITLTLTDVINLRGNGRAFLFIGGSVVGSESWTDSNTITFSNIPTAAGTYDMNLQLFMPTNTNKTVGVTMVTESQNIVLPTC